MTLRLDLLRHGETELGGGLRGSLDDALTELGWQQMRAAVADGGPWERIVSSPLQRCARFSEELAQRLSLPMQLEPGLQELHFGDWEGHSPAQLMETDAEGLGLFCRSLRLHAAQWRASDRFFDTGAECGGASA